MNMDRDVQHDDEWFQTEEPKSSENSDAQGILWWLVLLMFHNPALSFIAGLFD